MKELSASKRRTAEVVADIKMHELVAIGKQDSTIPLRNRQIKLARAEMSEVDEIKKTSTKEIRREMRELDWLTFDYGQTSVHDCQRLALLRVEPERRRARGTRQTGREGG